MLVVLYLWQLLVVVRATEIVLRQRSRREALLWGAAALPLVAMNTATFIMTWRGENQ